MAGKSMPNPDVSSLKSPDSVSPRVTRLVGFYCLVLLTLYNFASAGLIVVPVQFILKNQLHLGATQVSFFSFLTDGPFFVGFAFGFLRDRWRPFGKGDTGYFLFVPLLMGLVYLVLGYAPHTYAVLVGGLVALAALSSLLGAAAQGLVAAIAKDFGMMGRLSVVTYVTMRAALVYQQTVGSWLDEHSRIAPFIVSACVCVTVLLAAFWHPKAIFRSGDEVFVSVIPENATVALKRLLRHKAIYIPALILFLWDFAPGWGTPLFFYLTNTQKLSEAAFGASQGWLRMGAVLAALSYAWLCTRFKFKQLLYLGTFLGVIGGSIWADRWSLRQDRARAWVAAVGFGVAVPGLFLVGSSPLFVSALVGLILFGVGRGFFDTNCMPILRQISAQRYSATGYGFLTLAGCLVGGLVTYGSGALLDAKISLGIVFRCGGVVMAFAAVALAVLRGRKHAVE